MSETNLLQASPLSIEDYRIILRVLVWIAQHDSDYSDKEITAIQAIATEFGLTTQDLQKAHHEASVAKTATEIVCGLSNDDAIEALFSMIIILSFADGTYDARERTAARQISHALAINKEDFFQLEHGFATGLVLSADQALAAAKTEKSRFARIGKIAAASVIGGAALVFTAGLAAPAIGGAIGVTFLGLKGAAATSAGLALLGGGSLASGGWGMAGGALAIKTVFGAAGAGMAAHKMRKRTAGLSEFTLEDIRPDGVSVVIGISGFLSQKDDFHKSWEALNNIYPNQHIQALRWESQALLDLGKVLLDSGVKAAAGSAAYTATLSAGRIAAKAIVWPTLLLSAMNVIDNPWSIARSRAELAGLELAETLKFRPWGHRPVTLVGFSLGARVIVHALEQLAKEEISSRVESVILLGGAVDCDAPAIDLIRQSVSGHVINGYCSSDLILQYLYRGAEWNQAIGTAALERDGITDVDLSHIVNGHTDYRKKLTPILNYISHQVPTL